MKGTDRQNRSIQIHRSAPDFVVLVNGMSKFKTVSFPLAVQWCNDHYVGVKWEETKQYEAGSTVSFYGGFPGTVLSYCDTSYTYNILSPSSDVLVVSTWDCSPREH